MIEQFEQHRPFMFALAYRMLGTVSDAEDILQDAFVRVHAIAPATIRNLKSYLATVVTRLCLNRMAAHHDRDRYLGPWLPEPVSTEARPLLVNPMQHSETVDSLSIAFLVLLESLTAAERAVFLLHDVFDYKHSEIAQMLDKSEAACRQLLRRAKQHIHANRPRFTADPAQHETFLTHFIEVAEHGEIDTFLQLLADDVTLVPDGGGQRGAAIRVMQGRAAVAEFINGTRRIAPVSLQYVVRQLNGQPAIVATTEAGRPFFVIFMQTQGGVVTLMHVIAGRKLAQLGVIGDG